MYRPTSSLFCRPKTIKHAQLHTPSAHRLSAPSLAQYSRAVKQFHAFTILPGKVWHYSCISLRPGDELLTIDTPQCHRQHLQINYSKTALHENSLSSFSSMCIDNRKNSYIYTRAYRRPLRRTTPQPDTSSNHLKVSRTDRHSTPKCPSTSGHPRLRHCAPSRASRQPRNRPTTPSARAGTALRSSRTTRRSCPSQPRPSPTPRPPRRRAALSPPAASQTPPRACAGCAPCSPG